MRSSPGFGKEELMAKAMHLRSPFARPAEADEEVIFGAWVLAVQGLYLGAWRANQLQALMAVKEAVAPVAACVSFCLPV